MTIKKSWFEVDREGLKQLQLGKPKTYIIRELVQNCWDENIKECKVFIELTNRDLIITVTDDNPEGFKDLRDSFTLFKHTDKRLNPQKRGRFNIGEKQVFSICDDVTLKTTKGTIVFGKAGRKNIPSVKTDKGSSIQIKLKGSLSIKDELIKYAESLLSSKNINYYVNDKLIKPINPFKVFETSLTTQTEINNILKNIVRKTEVEIFKVDEDKFLFEMGLPVCKIECDYSINIKQKIPLSIDRETVPLSYLQDLYAEVLNNVYEDVTEENSSNSWIKIAMCDKRITKEAVETIINKRYGDRVVVANPMDKQSIDEAISNDYRVIYGKELSKEEWDNIKRDDLIQSSSDLFGTNFTSCERIKPNDNMTVYGNYAKRIAKRLLNIDLNVEFVKGGFNMVTAQFSGNTLTLNVSRLKGFFDKPISVTTTDLTLHELGHYGGSHTEENYHKLITKMGGELVFIALKEPEFFGVER